jgi:hypothetical protein
MGRLVHTSLDSSLTPAEPALATSWALANFLGNSFWREKFFFQKKFPKKFWQKKKGKKTISMLTMFPKKTQKNVSVCDRECAAKNPKKK